jgi:integrase
VPRVGYRLYDRPNSPFWWVYFSIAGHPKPYRLSTGVDLARRGEAERKAAQLLGERYTAGAGVVTPSALQSLTLSDLADLWIETLEAGGRPAKYTDRVTLDLVQYIEPRWKMPAEVTAESWEAATYTAKTGLAGELHHSRGGPLKWRSIAHLANTLRHFLRFCKEKGAISAVPEIRSPPTKLQEADRAPRAAMDEEKREKFLAALAELGELFAERVYTVFYETWMRKGSLQAMTLRWIDWKAETITMPAAYNKSRKEKVIDLAPRAATAIRAQLAANAAARAPDAPVPLDEPIFGPFDFHQAKTQVVTLKDGTKKRCPAGGVFGRACRKAGIDTYGLTTHHHARHTAMTIAGGKPGATLAGMMAQAGIDTASIIEDHYLHPSLDDARRITRAT